MYFESSEKSLFNLILKIYKLPLTRGERIAASLLGVFFLGVALVFVFYLHVFTPLEIKECFPEKLYFEWFFDGASVIFLIVISFFAFLMLGSEIFRLPFLGSLLLATIWWTFIEIPFEWMLKHDTKAIWRLLLNLIFFGILFLYFSRFRQRSKNSSEPK